MSEQLTEDQLLGYLASKGIYVRIGWLSFIRRNGIGPKFTKQGSEYIYQKSDVDEWQKSVKDYRDPTVDKSK